MDFPIPIIPFAFFIVCGLISLIYFYKMTSIIESKGVEVNSLFMNPWYYSVFAEIIKKEKDRNLKWRYRFILYIQLIIIPLYLFGLLFLLKIA